jgi:hypothetical protein
LGQAVTCPENHEQKASTVRGSQPGSPAVDDLPATISVIGELFFSSDVVSVFLLLFYFLSPLPAMLLMDDACDLSVGWQHSVRDTTGIHRYLTAPIYWRRIPERGRNNMDPVRLKSIQEMLMLW